MNTRYKFKTKPYAHQIAMIKKAMSQFRQGHGVAFLAEPRTGKSKATIDTLAILHQLHGLKKIVVIAPNRVLDTWVEQFAAHCSLLVQTIVWDKDARKNPLPTSAGPYDLQVVIVNYEAFSTPGRRTPSGARSKASGRFKHRQLLMKWVGQGPAACVVDEGHKIKSPAGKASTTIVSMRDLFAYRFLLTGTPVTKANRAHDIYMQWQWVSPDRFADWGATVSDFKNHTGRWIADNGYPQWVGPRPRGMEDLRKGLHMDGVVVQRDECLDLPPRMPNRIIPVILGPSAKHYDEMATDMVTKIRDGVIAEASIPLVVSLRLMQITSGFVGVAERQGVRGTPKLVSVPHRVGLEKLTALEELLVEEVLEREEKVVIAARFVPDLDAIEMLCKSLKLKQWSIRGKVSRQDSTAALGDFRRWQGAGVMLVQPAAASLGIDLSTAHQMVWFSLTPSWTDFTQCCDRIALSPRATTFTFLVAKGTIDEMAYAALQQDADMSKMILRQPEALLRK